jgi:1-acyl-sn-glycerol-3-phosphate acyltransferase
MWLLPTFSLVSSAAARVYYRLTVTGERIPCNGPALLVANHPNSLLDPVLVSAAARRPVRFLAKAPLFSDPKVGWLVRGAGAIPVYRRVDDPTLTGQNVDMFRAVYEELSEGAAIGIFPEGESHSEPSLVALKTGAARIALGTFALHRQTFPIIPVGLVLRQKDRFRSRAAVVLGQPIGWDDLAPRGTQDRETVRTLTDRIETGLRQVTVNLERWEDEPLVECAESIWRAEWDTDHDPASRVFRLEVTTRILAKLRRAPDPHWASLVSDVAAYGQRLGRLGLKPGHLGVDVRFQASIPWVARRLFLVALPAILLAVVGFILFWLPYTLTDLVSAASRRALDQRSTYKLLIGISLYGFWVLFLAAATAWMWNPLAGVGALAVIPFVGLAGLRIREGWRGAWSDARRFLLLRSRRRLLESLRVKQKELAVRLKALYDAWEQTAPN